MSRIQIQLLNMKKCKNYQNYKGIRKPQCNKGKGCDACNKRYTLRQMAIEKYKHKDVEKVHPSAQVREIVIDFRREKFVENVEYYLENVK